MFTRVPNETAALWGVAASFLVGSLGVDPKGQAETPPQQRILEEKWH